jgi:hypothetical protein
VRDKDINRFGGYVGGMVLAVAMAVPSGLAMAKADPLWIANAPDRARYSCSRAARRDAIPRAVWLLTAPRLIPIVSAISASDRSA